MKPLRIFAAGAFVLAFTLSVSAQTGAYWRFEEGPAGQPVPTPGPNGSNPESVLDSYGSNPMTVFFGPAAPTYSSQVPTAVVPATGAANTLSLDFHPNNDLYTRGTPLESQDLTAFTLEAAFMARDINRWQVIVGKDGKPSAGPEQTLALKLRDDTKQLHIELFDSTDTIHGVRSLGGLEANKWYYAAVVNDGTSLSLWLDSNDGLGYVLQGTDANPLSGALSTLNSSWTVGRGMFNGGVADWFDGYIDEVRISDRALNPSEFLFAVPEPGAMSLLAVGFLAMAIRRRR